MRKQALVIVFLLASLVTSAQSEEKNGWYLGTKMGWSHFNPLKNYIHESKSSSAPILGIFLGYEFNPYFGFEIENNTNGFFPHLMFQKRKENDQLNSVQIATKLSYPITDDFHLYSKLGGTVLWDNLSSKENLKNIFTKNSSLLPSLSLGLEYVFNKKFVTRLDYTWKTSIKNIVDHSIKSDLIGDAVFSFGWKFGNSHVNEDFSSYDVESLNQQYTALNENINFPFNSSDLKPVSYDKLKKLDDDIKNMKLKNISIMLLGHSDQIGSKEYNQKLSEDRAYSIKNYLTSKGYSNDQITVQGMGSLYPLTDQVCKNIENKPLLISCLAPDRRVEIEVLSSQ